MRGPKSKYYAEISILVDGWPWNLSEFDFRTACPGDKWASPVEPQEILRQKRLAALLLAVSGNRRVQPDRRHGDRRRHDRRKAA